jgi:hypothetical protein
VAAQGAVETLLLSALSDDKSPAEVGQVASSTGDVDGHSINITPRMTLSSYVLYDGTEMCKLQIPGGCMGETQSATWGKKVKKWRRWVEELKADAGAVITLPEDLDVPPFRRIAKPSTDT